MTINGVENTPDGPDIVHIADPGTDAFSEPVPDSAGFDSITHIPSHGASRALDGHAAFAGIRSRKDRHRSPTRVDVDEVLSGVPGEEARQLHDEAVQVRQLLPSNWDTHATPLIGPQPVMIADQRPERITIHIYNNGPATIYVGPQMTKASLNNGFPLVVGASLIMNNLGQMWACIDPGTGAQSDVRVMETWRTDNRGS